MTEGFFFSIAAALILGGYLVAVKRYFSDYPPTLFIVLSYAFGTVWYLPVILLTRSGNSFFALLTPTSTVVLAGTACFTSLALFAFYRALSLGDVSYIAPISKIVPVFVLPLEVVLLDQRLSGLQIVGVAVATAAVYVANYRHGSLLAPVRRIVQSKAALLALASAAAFGIVDVGKRVSMQEIGMSPSRFVFAMLVLVPIILLPAAVGNRHAVDWWTDRRLLSLAGFGLVVGQTLVAMAFQTLPASIASPVVNTQAVVAVVLGSLLLGESYVGIRLVAAGLAVFGIVLISLG